MLEFMCKVKGKLSKIQIQISSKILSSILTAIEDRINKVSLGYKMSLINLTIR